LWRISKNLEEKIRILNNIDKLRLLIEPFMVKLNSPTYSITIPEIN